MFTLRGQLFWCAKVNNPFTVVWTQYYFIWRQSLLSGSLSFFIYTYNRQCGPSFRSRQKNKAKKINLISSQNRYAETWHYMLIFKVYGRTWTISYSSVNIYINVKETLSRLAIWTHSLRTFFPPISARKFVCVVKYIRTPGLERFLNISISSTLYLCWATEAM